MSWFSMFFSMDSKGRFWILKNVMINQFHRWDEKFQTVILQPVLFHSILRQSVLAIL